MSNLTSGRQPRRPSLTRAIRVAIGRLQEWLVHALGVDPTRRAETVTAMLENNVRRAPGYWLQLFLAVGIATLGLALDSTAVVIGGMLVSPLMGPLVELGMGFAVGSSFLVIHAFLRTALSMIGAVAGAAALTIALPFHEVTREIASRTAPTLLDLLVAIFCALAAAYTAVRQTADTTAAAAGTAIGIALVPPLCVTGIGLGTEAPSIAGGAALLFTANFSAILVLAVISFLLLGYDRVDAEALERSYLEQVDTRTERIAARAHRLLRNLFGSRYGLAMRLLVPGVFLLSVYIPLRQALDEVTWQVRVREAIRHLLAETAPEAMQSSLVVSQRRVALRLVTVGSADQAANLERQLETRIAAASGVTPSVAVTAVADAEQLALAARNQTSASSEPLTVQLETVAARVGAAVRAQWPAATAGPLVGWHLTLGSSGNLAITVRHLGPPLGASSGLFISDGLRGLLGTAPQIVDEALPASPISAMPQQITQWLDTIAPLLDKIASTDSVTVCVTEPVPPPRMARESTAVRHALDATAAGRAKRLRFEAGSGWSLSLVHGMCASGTPSHQMDGDHTGGQ